MKFEVREQFKYNNGHIGVVRKIKSGCYEVKCLSCKDVCLNQLEDNMHKMWEEEKEMSIKDKIENINEDTTIKELDDLLNGVSENYGLWISKQLISIMSTSQVSLPDSVVDFWFHDQCSKLQALKAALLWLAKKSGKLKDNNKEIAELRKEFNSGSEQMQKISKQMEEIRDKIERLKEEE